MITTSKTTVSSAKVSLYGGDPEIHKIVSDKDALLPLINLYSKTRISKTSMIAF